MEPCRGCRVEDSQPGMERGLAVSLGLLVEPAAQLGIGSRSVEEPAEQRLEIECRAAYEQRSLASSFNRRDGLQGPVAIVGHAGGFPGLDHVDQVVRDASALCQRGFGRADVHAPIDRHRVHRDDLGIEPAGQRHADGRLAHGRRARQVDRSLKHVIVHRLSHSEGASSGHPGSTRGSYGGLAEREAIAAPGNRWEGRQLRRWIRRQALPT